MTDEFEQFWEVEKQASLNLEKSVDRWKFTKAIECSG
jgi:hypothetical protein